MIAYLFCNYDDINYLSCTANFLRSESARLLSRWSIGPLRPTTFLQAILLPAAIAFLPLLDEQPLGVRIEVWPRLPPQLDALEGVTPEGVGALPAVHGLHVGGGEEEADAAVAGRVDRLRSKLC